MSKYEEAFENLIILRNKDYNIVKEAILEAKAFDIIKEKRVNIEHLIFVGRAYNEHKVYATLTDEEFDLIEQALEVE